MGGYSLSNVSGDKTDTSRGGTDYWMVKLGTSGNIQWQNTIGGSLSDVLYSIQQTSDGGYILGGFSLSNASGDKTDTSRGGADYWVVKLDTAGTIQWQNTIGGSADDYLYSIHKTSDGGYILGGSSASNISGDKTDTSRGGYDYWVVKLDTSGAIQWQNTIGGSTDDWLLSIQQTSDGGYVLGGGSESSISGDKTENRLGLYDYWVVKLCGVVISDPAIAICNEDSVSIYGIFRSIAGTYYDSLLTMNGCDSVHSTVLTITTYSINDPDVAICNGNSVSIYGIFRSVAGTYYDSLTTTNGCDSVHSTVLSVDQLPTVNLGADTMICNSCSIMLNAGGGFTSYDWSTGDTTQTIIVDSAGIYIVTVTDANSCIGSDTIVVDIVSGMKNLQSRIFGIEGLQIYPNPTTGKFIIEMHVSKVMDLEIKLLNAIGQVIFEEKLNGFAGSYHKEIDLSAYSKGIYNLQLLSSEGVINKKLVVE